MSKALKNHSLKWRNRKIGMEPVILPDASNGEKNAPTNEKEKFYNTTVQAI